MIKTLSNYVQNLTFATSTFTYYDQNGNLITNYGELYAMCFVTINLIVDVSTTSFRRRLISCRPRHYAICDTSESNEI